MVDIRFPLLGPLMQSFNALPIDLSTSLSVLPIARDTSHPQGRQAENKVRKAHPVPIYFLVSIFVRPFHLPTYSHKNNWQE